jgi:thiol-disulfide isomerase/thioredoxin
LLLGFGVYSIKGFINDSAFLLIVIIIILGLIIGVLLLATSLNSHTFFEKICNLKENVNCDSLLKSSAGRVNEWLSWSEVGFFYFGGSFISLLIDPSSIKILFWLNLLSLPYTFYSIGYQFIKRQWCILCCSFQIVLWIEFASLSNYFASIPRVNLSESFLVVLLSFSTIIIGWFSIRDHLRKSISLPQLQTTLKRFKYDPEVYRHLLHKGIHFIIDKSLTPVVLGNREATNVITIVSNPYCAPCSKAHNELEELLEQNENLQVKIVFFSGKKEGGNAAQVASHIISLWKNNSTNKYEATKGWFGDKRKNIDHFIKQFPTEKCEEALTDLKMQSEWCKNVGIIETPTIYVNGYILPSLYELPELKYLIT